MSLIKSSHQATHCVWQWSCEYRSLRGVLESWTSNTTNCLVARPRTIKQSIEYIKYVRSDSGITASILPEAARTSQYLIVRLQETVPKFHTAALSRHWRTGALCCATKLVTIEGPVLWWNYPTSNNKLVVRQMPVVHRISYSSVVLRLFQRLALTTIKLPKVKQTHSMMPPRDSAFVPSRAKTSVLILSLE